MEGTVVATTLADEFMADFEDEEEEDQKEEEKAEERDTKRLKPNLLDLPAQKGNLLLKKDEELTKLRQDKDLVRLLEEITHEEEKGSQKEYQKISEANEMIARLLEEINHLYMYAKELYSLKFKELAELETNKLTYLRAVMRIGNETDLTKVELGDLVDNSILLVITVAATTTKGRKLSEEELASVLFACKEALLLEEEKNRLLSFVEGKMEDLAPNLTTLVGSKVAASLISSAGGLLALSKLPSAAIQSLGVSKKNLLGMASNKHNFIHYGYIFQAPLVLSCPVQHRTKVLRIICGRVALAARFDSFRSNKAPLGGVLGLGESMDTNEEERDAQGKKYREEILNKISKWQEPPPPKKPKPLAAPDSKKKAKRGGEKARKKKRMMEQTQVQKHMNRLAFSVDEAEDHYDDEDNGFGMLGKALKGNAVRISAQEKNIIKKTSQKKHKDEKNITATSGIRTKLGYKTGLKTLTSGAKSTLTLTDPNGMTFIATTGPSPLAENNQSSSTKYFSKTGNFVQLSQNNQQEKSGEFKLPLPLTKNTNK